MHHKNIKAIIRKQLKTNYRGWKNLTKRKKKQIAKQVLSEVVANYDFNKEIETPEAELLGIAQQELTAGMMNLDEMARFIDSHEKDVLFKLNKKRRHPLYLKDSELRFVDDLLDDTIINRLLSYDGFTPSMREFFPSHFLRGRVGRGVTPSPSSNRTSGFPASGFPLDFTKRHTQTVSTAVTTSRSAPALAGAGNNSALSEDGRGADCDDVND